jgi:hypothetical protein
MTDDISAPASGFDSASWLARDLEFVRLCKSALSENKTALFDALAGARIDTVEVTFNGYAGNGQIDEAVIDGEGGDADILSSTSRSRASNGGTQSSSAKPYR